MKKRTLLKSVLAGSLLKAWVPPLVTAITLPTHASTSCKDIQWQEGIGYTSRCSANYLEIDYEVFLFSDSASNAAGVFIGDVYDVYSNNPIHEVSWESFLHEYNHRIKIQIGELLPEGCDESEDLYLLSDLSPGQLFIETSCGTITIELGRD